MPYWAENETGDLKSPISTRLGFPGFFGALLTVFEGFRLPEGEELGLMGLRERRSIVTSDFLGSGLVFNQI